MTTNQTAPVVNPIIAAVSVALLQPAIDRFAARAAETGNVRLDMPLLKVPKDTASGTIDDALISRFRTVANAILGADQKPMKVDALVAFIQASLPSLRMPAVSYRDYEARPGKPKLDPLTNTIVTKPIPATRASFFGEPPTRALSPQAVATNKRLADEFASMLAAFGQTAATTGVNTDTGELPEDQI